MHGLFRSGVDFRKDSATPIEVMMISRVILVGGCVLLAACSGQHTEQTSSASTTAPQPPAPTPSLTVVPLTVPAPAGASEPQLTSSSRGTVLSWVESNGPTATLKFVERTSADWSQPGIVATGKD